MIIKLTPPQITEYWDMIKFAYVKGDLVPDESRSGALNEMLQALLSETAQCFIRISDDRQMIALMITRILINKNTGDKFLFIQCIFSFRTVPNTEWHIDWQFIQDFAKQEQCKYIDAESSNDQIFRILSQLGAKEIYRTFRFQV